MARLHFMALDSAAYLALVNGPLNMIPSFNCVGEDMRKNNSATLLRNLCVCLYLPAGACGWVVNIVLFCFVFKEGVFLNLYQKFDTFFGSVRSLLSIRVLIL